MSFYALACFIQQRKEEMLTCLFYLCTISYVTLKYDKTHLPDIFEETFDQSYNTIITLKPTMSYHCSAVVVFSIIEYF